MAWDHGMYTGESIASEAPPKGDCEQGGAGDCVLNKGEKGDRHREHSQLERALRIGRYKQLFERGVEHPVSHRPN